MASRQADIDFEKLQISYTVITAPATGIVSKRSIQLGQLVQAGQALVAIVHDKGVYVTANFKETQLEALKVGEKVDIVADAFSDKTVPGSVESFAGATGAKFSLLPPDNATGNFVKVVQRVPVRIKLEADSAYTDLLRPRDERPGGRSYEVGDDRNRGRHSWGDGIHREMPFYSYYKIVCHG